MANRSSLTLASMAVALFAAHAQTAIVAQWLLDEQEISDGTVAADTTGNWDGMYTDGSFFASGTFTSVTGHDGTPSSAVQFNKDAFVNVDTPAPADANDPNQPGGILALSPSFMTELWFKPVDGLHDEDVIVIVGKEGLSLLVENPFRSASLAGFDLNRN